MGSDQAGEYIFYTVMVMWCLAALLPCVYFAFVELVRMEHSDTFTGLTCEDICVSSSLFGAAATHVKLPNIPVYVIRAQYLEFSDLNH